MASQPFITKLSITCESCTRSAETSGRWSVVVDHHVDAPAQEVAAHEAQRVLHHLVHVDRPMLGLFLPEERPQTLDHRGRAAIALHDVVDDVRDLVEPRRRLREETLRRLCVAQDRRQRLVELVRERSRQRAQHANPRKMRHLVALARRRLLEAPPLRHVDDGREHETALLRLHGVESHFDRDLRAVLAAVRRARGRPPCCAPPRDACTRGDDPRECPRICVGTRSSTWPAHELVRRIAEHGAHLLVRERDRALPLPRAGSQRVRTARRRGSEPRWREAASTGAPRRRRCARGRSPSRRLR